LLFADGFDFAVTERDTLALGFERNFFGEFLFTLSTEIPPGRMVLATSSSLHVLRGLDPPSTRGSWRSPDSSDIFRRQRRSPAMQRGYVMSKAGMTIASSSSSCCQLSP